MRNAIYTQTRGADYNRPHHYYCRRLRFSLPLRVHELDCEFSEKKSTCLFPSLNDDNSKREK